MVNKEKLQKEILFLKSKIELIDKKLSNHTHQCIDSQCQSSKPIWNEVNKIPIDKE